MTKSAFEKHALSILLKSESQHFSLLTKIYFIIPAMTVNIIGNKTIKFLTEAYYLAVRTTDSSFFFDALYLVLNDPFKTQNSSYENEKIQKVIEAVGRNNFSNTLDIGCGNGLFSSSLLSVSKSVVGIDISSKAVKEAKNKYAGDKRLEFQRADICIFETDRKFDLFFCSEILYYLRPCEIDKTCERIKHLSENESETVFVGRADDEYVNSRLLSHFTLKKKVIVESSFPLYFMQKAKIFRPFGIFIYKYKKTER
ncbi:class I SAM-dependent methyltransferase [candidate division WOR-3 bacterium]|nr:class I SAM-dependent methyltransferase [candidate division WOR-3 bacterium]